VVEHSGRLSRNALAETKPEPLLAEDAARELQNLPREDTVRFVHLAIYLERSSSKAAPAAGRWLVGYLSEGTLSLRDVANVTPTSDERNASNLLNSGP
jgi:hypothetical protein